MFTQPKHPAAAAYPPTRTAFDVDRSLRGTLRSPSHRSPSPESAPSAHFTEPSLWIRSTVVTVRSLLRLVGWITWTGLTAVATIGRLLGYLLEKARKTRNRKLVVAVLILASAGLCAYLLKPKPEVTPLALGGSDRPDTTNAAASTVHAPSLEHPLPRAGTKARSSLEQLKDRLNDKSVAERRKGAVEISEFALAHGISALHHELFRPKAVSDAAYKSALRAIGAIVPNRRGRFPETRAEPVDWLVRLVESDNRNAGHADARYSVALLRALANTKKPDAAASILRFAYRHGGAFRDECGRLLRQMGDWALPALIRAPLVDDPLAYRMARYAAYQRDRLNRSRPELAIDQTDSRLKAEILHAFGEVRDLSAVPAIVNSTNDDNLTVRQSARWALLRFLDGPDQQVARRRLKLSGGRVSSSSQTLYLSGRKLAYHLLSEKLAQEQKKAGSDSTDPRSLRQRFGPGELASQLFAHWDQLRLRFRDTSLRRVRHLVMRGDPGGAMRTLDHELRTNIAQNTSIAVDKLYESIGLRFLHSKNFARAAEAFEKSRVAASDTLDGTSFEKNARREALQLVAEVLRSPEASVLDSWRLDRARQLAPDLAVEQNGTRSGLVSIAIGCGLGLMLIMVGLYRRRRAT